MTARVGRMVNGDPDPTLPVSHRFDLRVYHEDTDLGGIVYHANYLKFIERARSEWVRGLGLDQSALRGTGRIFVVRRLAAEFLSPARFDDLLHVLTQPVHVAGASAMLDQRVWRDSECLFAAQVTLVCVGRTGGAVRLPVELRAGGAAKPR